MPRAAHWFLDWRRCEENAPRPNPQLWLPLGCPSHTTTALFAMLGVLTVVVGMFLFFESRFSFLRGTAATPTATATTTPTTANSNVIATVFIIIVVRVGEGPCGGVEPSEEVRVWVRRDGVSCKLHQGQVVVAEVCDAETTGQARGSWARGRPPAADLGRQVGQRGGRHHKHVRSHHVGEVHRKRVCGVDFGEGVKPRIRTRCVVFLSRRQPSSGGHQALAGGVPGYAGVQVVTVQLL
mmetsp:Transcript_47866/g.96400  ORF Transcript_47866/g.96400 Transcript_47866/m.96400 type:complete len:238 (-) Transcript_47866:91-804(-)